MVGPTVRSVARPNSSSTPICAHSLIASYRLHHRPSMGICGDTKNHYLLGRSTLIRCPYHSVLCLTFALFPNSCSADEECKLVFGSLADPKLQALAKKKTQYIAADMMFNCSENITEWHIAACLPGKNQIKQRTIVMQLWRGITSGESVVSYTIARERSAAQTLSTAASGSSSCTTLSFSLPTPMPASSGDVVGFYVPDDSIRVILASPPSPSFTLYSETTTRSSPLASAADVANSFSTSSCSPVISAVFRESYCYILFQLLQVVTKMLSISCFETGLAVWVF